MQAASVCEGALAGARVAALDAATGTDAEICCEKRLHLFEVSLDSDHSSHTPVPSTMTPKLCDPGCVYISTIYHVRLRVGASVGAV